MIRDEILGRLQGVFDMVFLEPVTVTAELNAGEVEEWDSLTQISLVVAVEKEFSVRFHTGEVEMTRNVGEFADLILKRLNES